MLLLTKLSQMSDEKIILSVIGIGIAIWYLTTLIKTKNETRKILEILKNKKDEK